jgi:hypothetical protein
MPSSRPGVKRLSGRYRFKDRLWELNCGILGLGLSVGAAFTITGALKNAIGKPRPDLIDRYAGQNNETSLQLTRLQMQGQGRRRDRPDKSDATDYRDLHADRQLHPPGWFQELSVRTQQWYAEACIAASLS